jgi:tetratricopeptide (TPR) repeat protein
VQNDAEVIHDCRSGNPEVFRILVERYQAKAFAHALTLLGHREDALDAVQDSFLAAFRAIGGFDISREFYPWLYVILRNRCFTKRFNTDTTSFFNDDGLNLFELLGVTTDVDTLKLEPVEDSNAPDSFIFHFQAKWGSQDVNVEAIVAKKLGRLRSIRVFTISDEDTEEPITLCKLDIEAFDEPLDESLFVVAKSLTEDFRVGKIVDSEGIVTVKPVMRERWTPVSRGMVLKRGDWIRTDPRGPNAVAVRVNNAKLTLGPGSLVELIDKQQARVHRGEVQVEADKQMAFELIAGKSKSLKVEGKKLLRLAGDVFKVLTHTPMWLAGFEGTQSDESLGSLIANVDGRSVPLTVGYHKVTIEIRDQIARTTIEESFVNHTNSRLEGQFYFPLPQDASISGFGMWIGNELVEADVVEKQRAREIFETILREKRDPGLLEWTGGNIFKARVFPIFPHSEKRIKITYTQVLPLRGSKYRYTYGLHSELLKQTPLRELSIDLKVYSESKLRQISCPSHAARIDQTAHSGHIEFSAEEYSPDADFEAVIEIDGRSNDVVVIPHQRGDDGYFMLQVTPPGADANWQRDLLPDGQPLKLLLLADTSSSMDNSHRETQNEFIASLLMSLGPKDQFNLAACDVECDWVFDKLQNAGDDGNPIDVARDFLARRVSLGWTDLGRTFESVLERADENTHVVYIGDGVVTAVSADPDEFVNRLNRLTDDCKSTFHAITVGSSYETVVLKSIASVGGGSFRQVNAEQGPQDIAKELLSEITQPGLTDLNIEIRGIRVACMYPDELPNIAAGTQHIIIGRYLPKGKDQRGEVVVTGKRGDDTIRYKARFVLKDAEAGNSFIPRLRARAHLDQLLSQGRTAQVQDDVIALSEEYHIMTPYTSLLVLESDADRERFKVKRRFLMRDGEKFFAEGRKNANYELMQKQMKLAGLWRANLRTQILKSFVGMGRDASLLNPYQLARHLGRGNWKYGKRSGFGDYGWNAGRRRETERLGKALERDWDESFEDGSDDDPASTASPDDEDVEGEPMDDAKNVSEDMMPPDATQPPSKQDEGDMQGSAGPSPNDYAAGKDMDSSLGNTPYPLVGNPSFIQSQVFSFDGFVMRADKAGGMGRRMTNPPTTAWLLNMFPAVGAANSPDKQNPKWPAEAIELSNSLLRIQSLDTIHGLEINRSVTNHDPRWNRISSINSHVYLHSKERWANHLTTQGSGPNVYFCDADQRGVYSRSMLLGRVRKSEPSDRAIPNLPASDHSLRPIHDSYEHLTAKVVDAGKNRKRLMLSHLDYELRVLIDTERHVILETEEHRNAKQINRVVFSGFKTIAGRDWASKIETHRTINDSPVPEPRAENAAATLHLFVESNLSFRVLNVNAFGKRYAAVLLDKPQVQFLQMPLPNSADAKEARANGTADFDDHIVLADYFHRSGQWDRVKEHMAALETLAGDKKPGMWFIRNAMLREIGREPMRLRILERARDVAAKRTQDDFFMAEFLFGQMQQITAYNEQAELLDILKPVYDRQPKTVSANLSYMTSRISVLSGLGRNDLVLDMRREIATQNPWNSSAQTTYAYALINYKQDYDTALKWLRKSLKDDRDKWTAAQDDSLRNVVASHLESQARYAELLTHVRDWVERNPNSYNVHARLLTALVWNDKLDEAELLILKWLKEGVAVFTDEEFDNIKSFQPQVKKMLSPDLSNRMNAALNMAMGQGYNFYTYRIDPKWLQPLAKVALTFARQQHHRNFANRIVSHGHLPPPTKRI